MPMRCTAHSYLRLADPSRGHPAPSGEGEPSSFLPAARRVARRISSLALRCIVFALAFALGNVGSPASAEPAVAPLGKRTAAVSSSAAPGPALTRPLPLAVDRRQVAIIDLVGDEEAGQLGRSLAAQLVRHRELAPLADPAIAATLIGQVFDEDSAAVESARRALADAEDALARFELSVAAARAAAGQAELNNVQPTHAVMALYAELAFVLGQAKHADGDGPAARSNFLLTQRLAPDRNLDPARYLPDVITAFRQARRSGGGRVPVQIRGQGTAYVDGQSVGTAPISLDLAPGAHVIHLFSPSRLARGTRIEVSPTAPSVVVLPDARANLSVIVARGRRAAIAAAADPLALTTAVAQLARLIGISDVVVLARNEGALSVQAWRDRPPGAGMIHPVSAGDAVASVLLDLAPPTVEEMVELPPSVVIRGESQPSWYQRRWVQVSVAGALAVIATAIVLSASSNEGTVPIDPDPSFLFR